MRNIMADRWISSVEDIKKSNAYKGNTTWSFCFMSNVRWCRCERKEHLFNPVFLETKKKTFFPKKQKKNSSVSPKQRRDLLCRSHLRHRTNVPLVLNYFQEGVCSKTDGEQPRNCYHYLILQLVLIMIFKYFECWSQNTRDGFSWIWVKVLIFYWIIPIYLHWYNDIDVFLCYFAWFSRDNCLCFHHGWIYFRHVTCETS